METLIGRVIYDPNGNDDLRITGFRADGKTSLTNEWTGANTQLRLIDIVALENQAEDKGLVTRGERVTCPVCRDWLVGDHSHLEVLKVQFQKALDAFTYQLWGAGEVA